MNESTLVPREEASDLDWLARFVHVWPAGEHQPWCYVGTGYHDRIRIARGSIIGMSPAGRVSITRDQWLARRAELQNKPSWASAPEWAQFLGQDEDGVWYWHGERPNEKGEDVNGQRYWMSRGISDIACRGELLDDWRDTLEKRPAEHKHSSRLSPEGVDKIESIMQRNDDEFVPFVSVEDAKISIMQSEGDIKHFGGIIGRSITASEDAATAKQPAPKGSGNPILGMVLTDLTNRALEGKDKYGEPLLAHNGRNPLWDAYQEALDLAMYLRQAIEEQK